MSPAELEAGHRRLYREFYSWANIARRWPMAAGQGVAYLEFNLLYRKFGKLTCGLGEVFGMRRLATLATRLAYPSPDDPAEDAPGVRGEDRALVGVA
jgi:fido (protein-threonine AMPylation protein)